MAISANYPSPVLVNGFSCRNCTEVDYAKRNIDPARPEAGPFGLNDPQLAKAGSNMLVSSNMLVKRMDRLAADRAGLNSYSASGAPTESDAKGAMVDRLA